jgi:hypothetical protein
LVGPHKRPLGTKVPSRRCVRSGSGLRDRPGRCVWRTWSRTIAPAADAARIAAKAGALRLRLQQESSGARARAMLRGLRSCVPMFRSGAQRAEEPLRAMGLRAGASAAPWRRKVGFPTHLRRGGTGHRP